MNLEVLWGAGQSDPVKKKSQQMPYNTCVRETGVTVKLEGAEMVKLTERRRRNGSDDVLQGMLRNAMMKY